MMTMQRSLTKIKTITACEQALHLRDIKRSHSRVARERRRRGSKVQASALTRAFACHSKWRGCFHFITFLSSCARSLFGEPVYIKNSEGEFELFTY